jgi:hypothetical protein
VEDAVRVQVLEAQDGIAHPAPHQRLGHVLLAINRSGQVAARHELHHEVHAVVRLVVDDLEELHAVGVAQGLHHADLLEDPVERRALAHLLALQDGTVQDLDRHVTASVRVQHPLGAVDDAIRTLSEHAVHRVVVDVCDLVVVVHLDVELRRHRHLLAECDHAAASELPTVASLHAFYGLKPRLVVNVDGKLLRRDSRRHAAPAAPARHASSSFRPEARLQRLVGGPGAQQQHACQQLAA